MNISCWIAVEDGLKGTENQCFGVAEALGVEPVIKHIKLREPWKSLSPMIGFEDGWSFETPLEPPWPDLLIAGGRKSIAASRFIKKQSGGRTFTVQLQDPRVHPGQFDLVAVPEHDSLRGDNVIVTKATPNRVTQEKLEQAKTAFPNFEALPSPRVAVLIGGTSKAYTLSPAITKQLCAQLLPLDAGLMITTSRRTGAVNEAIIRETLGNANHFIWDGHAPNPYFGMLAWADIILVTADSASMLSEACTSGQPVYMIPMEGGHKRFDKLHNNLIQHGALRIFNGTLESWHYEPLQDAKMVADEIRKRMKL